MSGESILSIAFNSQVDFSYFDMKQKGKKIYNVAYAKPDL